MNWKATSIILLIIIIIQTLLTGYLFYIGNKLVQAETDCEIICWEDDNCGSYYFDDYAEVCYILDYDGEVIDTKRMW